MSTIQVFERQEMTFLRRELDDQETAALQSVEKSDFGAGVELTMTDDLVTGAVAFGDQESVPFTADAATWDGGICWAVSAAHLPRTRTAS